VSDVLGPVARVTTARQVRVLMYHRFSHDADDRKLSAEAFRAHLEYITRHFTPMSLSNMVDAALGERTLPPRPVIVTVDDGYADFFDIAYPLLCRYRVPACVFVVSAFVEGRDWAWYDKMRYILRESSLPTLQIETGGVSRVFPLRTPADREAAWQHLATEGLSMTIAARNRRIVEMAGAADVDVPAAVPEDFRSSSVDELRGMDPDLVEIGGHTETHPILSHCSDDELECEIVTSRAHLQRLLDRPIDMFCYPNGGPADFDARAVREVARAGYRAATMVGGGPCSLSRVRERPFEIPRHSIGPGRRETRNGLNGVTYLQERFSASRVRSYTPT
jgi:peptidoglycan/xylan/chitin deacetylase (PgdA/CDA1 family)